jgi:hypothetical protein
VEDKTIKDLQHELLHKDEKIVHDKTHMDDRKDSNALYALKWVEKAIVAFCAMVLTAVIGYWISLAIAAVK